MNYSVTGSQVSVDVEEKTMMLALTVDTEVSSVMEYFEIFMKRMLLCRKSAETLGLSFRLEINGQKLV